MRRCRRFGGWWVGLLLVGAGAGFAAESKKVETFSFEAVQTTKVPKDAQGAGAMAGKTVVETSQFWIKGGKLRVNQITKVDGKATQQHILIQANGHVYILNVTKKEGLKQKLPSGAEANLQQAKIPAVLAEQAKKQGKKKGKETIDGQACNIYEWQPSPQVVQRVWLRASDGLGVKVTVQPKDKSGSVTLLVRNIKKGGNIADSLFTVPKGYKVQNAPPPQAPPAPGGPAPK